MYKYTMNFEWNTFTENVVVVGVSVWNRRINFSKYIFLYIYFFTPKLFKGLPHRPPPGFPLNLLNKEVINKCVNDTGANLSELENLKGAKVDVSESLLWLFKCVGEESNILNEDGTVNLEELNQLPKSRHLRKDMEEKLNECIKNVDPIKECSDMKKLHECFKPPSRNWEVFKWFMWA